MLPQLPLRETIAAANEDITYAARQAFPMPADRSSANELRPGLSTIARRDTKEAAIQRIIADAGIDLNPAAACLIVRSHEGEIRADSSKSANEAHLISQLQQQSYIEDHDRTVGDPVLRLTKKGLQTFQRLKDSRIKHLTDI
jgi:hypothetical protein